MCAGLKWSAVWKVAMHSPGVCEVQTDGHLVRFRVLVETVTCSPRSCKRARLEDDDCLQSERLGSGEACPSFVQASFNDAELQRLLGLSSSAGSSSLRMQVQAVLRRSPWRTMLLVQCETLCSLRYVLWILEQEEQSLACDFRWPVFRQLQRQVGPLESCWRCDLGQFADHADLVGTEAKLPCRHSQEPVGGPALHFSSPDPLDLEALEPVALEPVALEPASLELVSFGDDGPTVVEAGDERLGCGRDSLFGSPSPAGDFLDDAVTLCGGSDKEPVRLVDVCLEPAADDEQLLGQLEHAQRRGDARLLPGFRDERLQRSVFADVARFLGAGPDRGSSPRVYQSVFQDFGAQYNLHLVEQLRFVRQDDGRVRDSLRFVFGHNDFSNPGLLALQDAGFRLAWYAEHFVLVHCASRSISLLDSRRFVDRTEHFARFVGGCGGSTSRGVQELLVEVLAFLQQLAVPTQRCDRKACVVLFRGLAPVWEEFCGSVDALFRRVLQPLPRSVQ